MGVSVETLNGLERKITVSVPSKEVEEKVSNRLRQIARNVKVAGFRPGKVPMHIVQNRFTDNVHEEITKEIIESTLFEALKDNALFPAGSPSIEPQKIEKGKDFIYSAMFEVVPEIKIKELNQDEIELVQANVQDKDVEAMLAKLQEQNKEWHDVARSIAKNDKAIIDFKGFVGGEAFAGGTAEDFEIVIGSGSMIPGFEDQLIGGKVDKPFKIQVTFPADYNHQELAGKEAEFEIKIKKVMEGKLPELDQAFAEKFNIKEGGIAALKKDIKENMARELNRRINNMNRERIFDKMLTINQFDLPTALINQEIEHLKHEMYHRLFGAAHHDNEKIPDFPRILFEDKAKRRVHLGLLFAEYVKHHNIKVDDKRVEETINKFASAYEDPEELRQWYQTNKESRKEIESLVIEEMVAEKISEHVKLVEKQLTYDEIMNPKEENEKKGE